MLAVLQRHLDRHEKMNNKFKKNCFAVKLHSELGVCAMHLMWRNIDHLTLGLPFAFIRVSSFETIDLRDLKTDGYTVLPESAAEELSPQHDPYDWLLYVFLLDIFVENLERYGIAIPEQLKSHWKVVQKGCKIWLSHPEDEQSWTAHAARYCLGIHEIKQNITHRHKHRSTSLDIWIYNQLVHPSSLMQGTK